MTENYRRDFVEHLKKTLSKGYEENLLRVALIKQGYSETVIDRAMGEAKKELADEAAAKEKKEKPQIRIQIFDENNRLIQPVKKSFWKRIFGRS